jgi:outer membrane protein OmpA-like peptidoglycan-associated protein
MNSERSMLLTPLLQTADYNKALPPILINGYARQKLYKRKHALHKKMPRPEYAVIESRRYVDKKSTGKYTRTIDYKVAIPYEDWMYNANIVMVQDVCGCAGHKQKISIEPLVNQLAHEVRIIEKVDTVTGEYDMHPLVAYIRPQVETVKSRDASYEVFLTFPTGKTVIVPTFGNNSSELTRISTIVNDLGADKNLQITGVDITGYASLEGSEAANQRLADARAKAFLGYLQQHIMLGYNLLKLNSGGEDWALLNEGIQHDPMLTQYGNELTHILSLPRTADQKEWLIRQLDRGTPYRYISSTLYPKMRRVQCKVNYIVKPFSLDEAKEVYKKAPQQLSLDEMFNMANSYDTSDRHFAEVFQTAVRLFPNDQTANLNAAAVALQVGSTDEGKEYLDKADKGTPEYANNIGVYYLLKGNYDAAAQWLSIAAEHGSKEAVHNQTELKRKKDSQKK